MEFFNVVLIPLFFGLAPLVFVAALLLFLLLRFTKMGGRKSRWWVLTGPLLLYVLLVVLWGLSNILSGTVAG